VENLCGEPPIFHQMRVWGVKPWKSRPRVRIFHESGGFDDLATH
jgi:hypothetical protein